MHKIEKFLENNHLVFLFLGLLVVIDRIGLFINFNFKYTGSDDMIFWQSATDYMHGIFHEPYFYGQNYNFMLESVLAIPFIKLGIPYNYSFPIVTSLMGLFPFFLFAILLFKRTYIIESFFFLVIPIVLPIEYGILTSITRGFVSGLFFSGFLIFCLLNPTKRISFYIFGLSVSLGYIFNPNSLVFAVPIGIYLFLKNYKDLWFYPINAITIIPVLLIQYYAKQFYALHPDYNVTGMWDLHFSVERLIENFNYLDKFYGLVTPVFWSFGPMVLIFILIFGIIAWKSEWEKGLSIIFGLAFIIVSLGINKVNDDLGTIFLSSTRMFLGIPLFFALSFFWSKDKMGISDKKWIYVLVIMSLSVFFVKLGSYKVAIKYHTYTTNYGALAVKRIDNLETECSQLADVVRKYNIDLIVFVPDGKFNIPSLEFYDYGCPLLEKQFSKTMLTIAEKRTWVYLKEKTGISKNLLVFGISIDTLDILDNMNCKVISNEPPMTVIKDNTMETEKVLSVFNIYPRRNGYSDAIPQTEPKLRSFKAFNNKYVCDDAFLNHIVAANRDSAREWETFGLSVFGNNKCVIRSSNNTYLSTELGSHPVITATRNQASNWEIFTLIKLDSNHVAFKGANRKYLTVDEKSCQLYARADSIGKKEKFEIIKKADH